MKAKPMRPKPKSLVFLSQSQLLTHPRNMRRFYSAAEVQEMADSIKAATGVVQAMLVVPAEEPDTYYVVDGNMRLAGARTIGDACPLLKCEIVDQSTAEQMLTMVVANKFRYDPDPISEALHYRNLQGEGLTLKAIADATGVHYVNITNRLKLLELDEPIQKLIAEGKLPMDRRVAEALLSLPSPEARIKLASRLAHPGIRIRTIVDACARLSAELQSATSKRVRRGQPTKPQTPMLAHANLNGSTPAPEARQSFAALRESANAMCAQCDIKTTTLKDQHPEPAWALVAHTAGEICRDCSLRDLESVCRDCPGVILLRRLAQPHAKP